MASIDSPLHPEDRGNAEPARKIRVLLVGGHTLGRDALTVLLAADTTIAVVADGDDAADAFAHASGPPPDVVIVDIDRDPAGAARSLAQVKRLAAAARVLVLTGGTDRDLAGRLVLAGAMGLVSKDRPGEHLRDAIRKVHDGELWIARAASAQIIADMAARRGRESADPAQARIASLTPRERDVIRLVAEGLSNKAIAVRMQISDNTVRHHLTSIFSKLEIADRLALVVYTYHHKIA